MNIDEFVEETRERVIADADGDSYEEYVDGQGLPATRLAFGLLALGEVAEAKRWFAALGPLWVRGARFAVEFRLENKEKHASALPVNKWFRALSNAVLSGDRTVWRETAGDVYDQITAPNVRELDGTERAGRLASYTALSGLGAGADVQSLVETVRQRATSESRSETPYAWDGIEFNGPQADLVAGINDGDTATVTDALGELLYFHEEYRVGNRDTHEIEREIDFHATTYVALARQEGLDVRVDSEYVPDAVCDGEHYPVG